MKSNNRFIKVAVATGLIVCSGAAVLGLTSFASAQVANNPVAVVTAAGDSTTTDSGAPAATGETGTGSITAQAVEGEAAPAITEDHANRPKPLVTAAKALGMTEAELRTELQAGKSISDVAKAKNVDLADVKKALLDEMKTHLAEEVASGEHTQAEADAKLAEATTRIDTMLTTSGLPMGRGGHGGPGGKGGHGGPAKFATADLAKVLKLTDAELQTQLQSGKSLADIAKAQNVDIADVKAQLTADFTAHLDEEVKAGEHTQAEADAKLTEFKTRLDDMVNGVRPARGMKDGMGAMGGRGHGGPGGHGHGEGHSDGPMGVPGATDGASTSSGASFSA